MIIVSTVADLRREVGRLRQSGRRIAFVPTMGNLHQGHVRLVEEALRQADAVVASVYVNPLQFGAGEDFASYPRTPEHDREALGAAAVDLLFSPDDRIIYPRGLDVMTRVEVPGLSDILCGAHRPGHFRGVTTVVNRLLNLVQPDLAVFGKKDYQQLLLIRLMVSDLGLPVEIAGVETVREPDGLALSSRNGYLSAAERKVAPRLHDALSELGERLRAAPDQRPLHEQAASGMLVDAGFRPDYVSVRRQRDLGEPGPGDDRLVALAAAWLGRTRLIDNIEIKLP
jgi:pantoate--beta-alanine ligase